MIIAICVEDCDCCHCWLLWQLPRLLPPCSGQQERRRRRRSHRDAQESQRCSGLAISRVSLSITLLSVGAASSRSLWCCSHLTLLLLLLVSISLLELSQMDLTFCSISFDTSSAVDGRETCQLLRSIPDLPKALCSLARNVIILLCSRDFSWSYLGGGNLSPIHFLPLSQQGLGACSGLMEM